MKRIGFLWEKFCTLENAKMAITLGTKTNATTERLKENSVTLDHIVTNSTLRKLISMQES
jgi:hypothetical protein